MASNFGKGGKVKNDRPVMRFPHRCYLCGIDVFNEKERVSHITSDRHILIDSFRNNRSAFKKLTFCDLFKVTVKHLGKENEEIRVRKDVRYTITLEIKCTTNSVSILNVFCVVFDGSFLEVDIKKPQFPLVFLRGESQKMYVSITVLGYGLFELPIAFNYATGNDVKIPYHSVILKIVAESDITATMRPVIPYVQPKKKLFIPVKDKVPGPKVELSTNSMEVIEKMKQYFPPECLWALVQSNLKKTEKLKKPELWFLNRLQSSLGTPSDPEPLTPDNYARNLEYLLYFEEIQENIDLDQFSKSSVRLIPVTENNKEYLRLEVGPGLADGRPSLMVGDRVLIHPINGSAYEFRKGWYIGIVRKVQLSSVYLLLKNDFHEKYSPSVKVNVKFEAQRSPYRTAHRALELITKQDMAWLFFPKQNFPFSVNFNDASKIKFINKRIEDNPEQRDAVIHIVHRSSLPYPYLVFGPPGTGKTVTLVEVILQNYLFNLENPRKQLVCASSNAAADVITERLIKAGVIPDNDILRMYSPSTNEDKLPDVIREHKNVHNLLYNQRSNTHEVHIPDIDKIMHKAVVITTLVTAGRLVSGAIPTDHFSHVLIDESGHSMEPECLIPIMGIVTGNDGIVHGQIVLAGDPKQLGPVLVSVSKDFGLQVSLLERLMNTQPIYRKDPKKNQYNVRFVSKLVRNFRSHPAILKLPNEFFYDNELKTMGSDFLINRFSQWDGLVTKGFPIIFHGLVGSEAREHTSPSYFNLQEIDQVVDYLEQLIGKTVNGKLIKQTDIGVVSPYKKQVQKLHVVFKQKRWTKVTLGSVEQLQGDEKLIIIISTVRSQVLKDGCKMALGFLKNPKRFNVAITRAQALLIIVGNPHVLKSDEYWGRLLRYCIKNGGYRGEHVVIKNMENLGEDNSFVQITNSSPKAERVKNSENCKDVATNASISDDLSEFNNRFSSLTLGDGEVIGKKLKPPPRKRAKKVKPSSMNDGCDDSDIVEQSPVNDNVSQLVRKLSLVIDDMDDLQNRVQRLKICDDVSLSPSPPLVSDSKGEMNTDILISNAIRISSEQSKVIFSSIDILSEGNEVSESPCDIIYSSHSNSNDFNSLINSGARKGAYENDLHLSVKSKCPNAKKVFLQENCSRSIKIERDNSIRVFASCREDMNETNFVTPQKSSSKIDVSKSKVISLNDLSKKTTTVKSINNKGVEIGACTAEEVNDQHQE